MKVFVKLVLIALFSVTFYAQSGTPKASPKATITQIIGVDTKVEINYSRPAVKGRKVWGGIVPFGLAEGVSYSKNKPFPWRAGANENTTIEFNNDVKFDGKTLPAGKYGIHMIPAKDGNWTIIFSKKSDIWGSYAYDAKNDGLRIKVRAVASSHEEWLRYGFDKVDGNSAVAFLKWEKLKIPFTISL